MKRILLLITLAMTLYSVQAETPLQGKVMNILGDSYVANHQRPKSEA